MGIKEFIEHLVAKNLGEKTIKQYALYYKRFDAGLSDKELNQEYINDFIIRHPSSITRSFLNNLFQFLNFNFKIPKPTGRKPKKKRKIISPQEIKGLRAWLHVNKPPRYLIAFDLNYYCALRREEVVNIRIDDFYMKEWAEDPSKACRLLIHGKGKRERFVAVPSRLMHRIIEYLGNRTDNFDPEGKLFGFSYAKWHEGFKQAVRATLDYNYKLHDLRKSRATKWLQEGKNLVSVGNRLGHASIQTTQLYINLDEEKEFESWASE